MTRVFRTPYDDATCVKTLTDGAHIIEQFRSCEVVQHIWTRNKLRKDNNCSRCYRNMAKGEVAFRPMSFTDVRPDRLCEGCVGQILAGVKRDVAELQRLENEKDKKVTP